MAAWAVKRITGQEAGKKPGDCFISTATATSLGWSADGPELDSLRQLRDTFMQETVERRAEVAEYYRIAPKIVDRINREPDAASLWRELADSQILPIVRLAQAGRASEAHSRYRQMVHVLCLTWHTGIDRANSNSRFYAPRGVD